MSRPLRRKLLRMGGLQRLPCTRPDSTPWRVAPSQEVPLKGKENQVEAYVVQLPPPPEGGSDLAGLVHSLAAHVLRVVRGAVRQGGSTALTMIKLWYPEVDLGPMARGMPKKISEKQLEEAKEAIAPLVDAAVGVVDDKLLLRDEYPEEDGAPVVSLASP